MIKKQLEIQYYLMDIVATKKMQQYTYKQIIITYLQISFTLIQASIIDDKFTKNVIFSSYNSSDICIEKQQIY